MGASNSEKKLDMKELEKMFDNITEIKERNKEILKAIDKGYSQH